MLMMLSASAVMAEETNVIATVNGVNVPIDEAYEEYAYYAMIYEMYGFSEEDIAQLRSDVAESYAQLEVIYQKFDELGLTVDMEQIEADAAAEFEVAIESYLTYVDSGTDEEMRASAIALLAEDGYDEEYFVDYMYSNARVQAVIDHQTADIAVTEDSLKAYYDERVAADQQLYGSDPAAYDEAIGYGESVLYAPEGIRAVKHILVLLDEESESLMYDLEADLEGIETALAAEGADVEALNQQKAEVNQQIDEVYATIEPRAQEIMDKLAAGEDFIALMEEYGEDPGMTYEPYMTDGYLVWADCESWVLSFRDGAMALEKAGDISQPVRTSYGLHIIRYERDIQAGAVPFEEVREELAAELLTELQNERVSALLAEWYEAAEITLYPENLLAMDEAAAEAVTEE